ncbi:MAG: Cna B-type domain-containing protein, partial [Clostridia bacterium]|nr:Cna B-type domain-containing protein [Clostridia bacterium]
SVLSGGTEDAHVTKYKVEYKKSGSTYTITNMAILEIDVIKRWIGIGVDDDDMPDSAWVVLMCSPKEGALDSASDLASGLGVDIGGVLDYEFPVINPEEGGKDALTLLSELSIGLDVSMIGKLAEKIFGVKIPELAVAKVDEDCDWKAEFVLSKYNCGVPMDYKGAELWSEIIRQIIKYLIGFSLPVSFNPFDGYISIPTKAIPTILGIENPEDILDLSGLAGKALEKAKSLTMDDISNFGWSTVVDDYHLMANVINIKIDWDHDDDDTLSGSKFWADDDEDKRPDYILIHVKDADGDIEGSPITLRKSEFEGKDEWEWELTLPDDPDGLLSDATYVVSEEYPADYAYKDDYTCEIDGLDITNTWHKEDFTISGTKIWRDGNDADGIRPETVTIRLLADGVEVASAVTSRAGDWKYFFPNQPKTKDGRTIEYTVIEDPVPGYAAKTDGYNIINTAASDLRVIVSRSEADAAREQSFIFTVRSLNEVGGSALSLRVMIVLAAGETSGSALIKAVPAGEYSVTESSDWSWRYFEENGKTVKVEPGKTAEASFGLDIDDPYWLDACGSEDTESASAAPSTQTAAILPDTDEDKKRYRQNV